MSRSVPVAVNPLVSRRNAVAKRLELSPAPYKRLLAESPSTSPYDLAGQYRSNITAAIQDYIRQGDPVAFSTNLANSRLTALGGLFELQASGSAANTALLIAGSINREGSHTFNTDADFVVVAARKEDLPEARRLHGLMAKTAEALGIKPDYAIPRYFNDQPLDQVIGTEVNVGAGKNMAVLGSYVIDSSVKAAVGSADWLSYIRAEFSLEALRINYANKAQMIDSFRQSYESNRFRAALRSTARNSETARERHLAAPEIKEDALLPFFTVLSALKLDRRIEATSPFVIADRLVELKLLSVKEREKVGAALRYFSQLRHLLSLFVTTAEDSTNLNDEVVAELFADGTPDFKAAEFQGYYQVDRLSAELSRDQLVERGGQDVVADLNALLNSPDFYDHWRVKYSIEIPAQMASLRLELGSLQGAARAHKLRLFNRLLLELTYESCPPSFATDNNDRLNEMEDRSRFLGRIGLDRLTFHQELEGHVNIMAQTAAKLWEKIGQ